MGKNDEWVNYLKKFAFDNKISYMQALTSVECQKSYTKKPKKPYVSVKKNKTEQKELVINVLNNNIDRNYFRTKYFELLEKEEDVFDRSKKYREIYNNKNRTK